MGIASIMRNHIYLVLNIINLIHTRNQIVILPPVTGNVAPDT